MKRFVWCPQEGLGWCRTVYPVPHAHICIRSVGAEITKPECDGVAIYLAFYDLDPAAIKRTSAYEKNPVKGQELIDGCFTEDHAKDIASFVEGMDALFVVNCEAGISRSPGVVLALRRHYGGGTEDVFDKAHPNIHVASVLSRVLKRLRPQRRGKR